MFQGIIEPCCGPWASPILLVKKKNLINYYGYINNILPFLGPFLGQIFPPAHLLALGISRVYREVVVLSNSLNQRLQYIYVTEHRK